LEEVKRTGMGGSSRVCPELVRRVRQADRSHAVLGNVEQRPATEESGNGCDSQVKKATRSLRALSISTCPDEPG
jgi:hypothetical protein